MNKGQTLAGSTMVIILYLVFIALSTLSFVSELSNPSLLATLSLTRGTPWGVVTSIFAHVSLSHLANNMASLATLSLILAALLLLNRYPHPRQMARFFSWGPLVSATGANIVELAFSPHPTSAGASGLVYATVAVVISAATFGIVIEGHRLGTRAYLTEAKNRMHLALNLSFLYFPPAILLAPSPGPKCP